MRKIFGILFLTLVALRLTAQDPSGYFPEGKDYDALRKMIEAVREKADIPGLAIGIVENNQLVFAEGFGVLTKGKPEKVDKNTLFGIASNTKAFTAMSIMILVEQGKLSLDDKVTKYLPWFKAYNDYVTTEMTVKDLMAHHSGLKTFSGDLIWYASDHTREEIVKRSQHLLPENNFRDKFGYSNIHFLAAGLIVEKVSGMSYDAFLEKNIFKPLGMNRTNSSITKNPADNVASPHAIKNYENIPVKYVNWDNIAPAGSINSSIADMSQWLICLLNKTAYTKDKRLISENNFYKMLQPVTNIPVGANSRQTFPSKHFNGYALGLNVFDYHGSLVASHSGGLVGMVSQTAFVPEKGFGFVILSNNETGVPGVLMYDILDFMMNESLSNFSVRYAGSIKDGAAEEKAAFEKKWNTGLKDTEPKADISTYTGKFSGKVYGGVTISDKSSGKVKRLHLAFDHSPSFHANLNYYKEDVFWFEFDEYPSLPRGTVMYKRDSAGKITQIVIDVPNPDFDFSELDLMKQ